MSLPDERGRGRALPVRRVLALIFATAAVYLVVLAFLISLRLVPEFRDSVSESRGILTAFDRVSREIERLDRNIAALDEIVTLGATLPASIRPSAQERVAPAGVLEAARLGHLPPPLRIGLAAAAETESEVTNLLQRLATDIDLGDFAEGRRTLALVREQRDVLARQLDRALQAGYADVAQRQQMFADAAQLAWRAVAAWLALGVLLVPTLWLWLRRRLIDPMARLDAAVERVAAGDLDTRLVPGFRDEMGRLSEHFNRMTEGLQAEALARQQEAAALERRLADLQERAARLDEADRREAEVRERLAQLAEAQHVVRTGSFTLDLRSSHLTCSDELCAILGTEPARFGATYQDFLRFVHPDDADAVQARLHACLNDHVGLDMTHRIVRADGTPGVVRHRGQVMRDPSGHAVRLVATLQVLTERD